MRALVTGGSRGIGLAVASALYASGARVGLVARDAERLRAAADQLGEGATWQTADVGDAGQVQAAVDRVAGDLGGLDVVVTASGFGTHFSTETAYEPGKVRPLTTDDVVSVIGQPPRPVALVAAKPPTIRYSDAVAIERPHEGHNVQLRLGPLVRRRWHPNGWRQPDGGAWAAAPATFSIRRTRTG